MVHQAHALTMVARPIAGFAFANTICWFAVPRSDARDAATIVLCALVIVALFASAMLEERAARRLSVLALKRTVVVVEKAEG